MDVFTTNIFIIKISTFLGFFFVFSSIILFIIILLKRVYLIKKEKRDSKLLEEWRPILLANLYSLPPSFDKISKKNTTLFLIFWNNLQDILKGPEKEQLNHLARLLHMDQAAIKMLSSRKLSQRLLAIAVLGNLREEQAWDKIQHFSESSNMTLAINAMHALTRIDPERVINIVISFMIDTQDWPDYKIAMILNEMGATIFSKPLADEILLLSPERQPRLLNMMNSADGKVVLPLILQLLSSTNNNEVISSCLNLLSIFGDYRDIPVVKDYLNHQQSFIRMRAVMTLSLIGNEYVLPFLERCLSDPDWWVRYRTAEAIKLLPTMNNDRILEIRDRQLDRFAVDILNYVIS